MSKLGKILDKSVYKYPNDLYLDLKEKELDKYSNLSIRMLIRYLKYLGYEDKSLVKIKGLLKSVRSNFDQYVPNDNEVKNTLDKLGKYNKLVYMLFLASGIRKVEGKYILENITKLKVQTNESFVKINMSLYRNTKNCFFCYLPIELWDDILNNIDQISLSSLEMCIKRNKLIPIKYCRKWFYTKCINLGIPEAIADFYQGRNSNGIGSNHYLAKQSMADKMYGRISLYFDPFHKTY